MRATAENRAKYDGMKSELEARLKLECKQMTNSDNWVCTLLRLPL